MTETNFLSPIPGPDPGACAKCGEWVKAGIPHECAMRPERTAFEQSHIPLFVYWDDESGRTREVVKTCKICLGGVRPVSPSVVSPRGVAHEARRGDTTDCGRDCTGPEWWIRG